MLSDFLSIIQWWGVFFVIGIIFIPLTFNLFSKFSDLGYLFSKVLGLAIITYILFVLNVLHVLPFSLASIILAVWLAAIFNGIIMKKIRLPKKIPMHLIIFEEVLFFAGIVVWSFVRAHEPSINGLEKFMDFGFLNSILRTTYQPAVDMWFPPLPINYYYFGHMATAVATELSLLTSNITFNLMIATLFSFCFSLSFSLGSNIISFIANKKSIIGGLLIAALVTFAGNLHTIYTLFKAYDVNNPVPFWQLPFLPNTFPNAYWYPNATRFIPFTIHEFPIYSFVVSDMHGHVLDIPFVLLTIALSYVLLTTNNKASKSKDYLKIKILKLKLNQLPYFHLIIPLGFVLAVMYMTNVWDGLIYMLLIFLILLIKNWQGRKITQTLTDCAKPAMLLLILFFIFSLPFNIFFKPFASGVGVLCAPAFLTNMGRIGPILFEANHCQKSTWWELATLYGFFYFFVISFIIFIFKRLKKLEPQDIFVLALMTISTLLIIVPEFIYLKDIYPQHYRANTMFKLVYQSFMMLSISSGYVIVRILSLKKNILFFIPTAILLGFVFIYPYYAISSYYNSLKTYSGLDGSFYLKAKYPEDYAAINWINQNIQGRPVMLEAQGDSYTDYERISANTGLPTILGWTVHEWLWRGSYNIPAPRIADVQNIYTSSDIKLTKQLLKKYHTQYVYLGQLEHEKYPNLIEDKFGKIGKVVFQSGTTKIYKLNI